MPGRLAADVDALGMDIIRDALATYEVQVEVSEFLETAYVQNYPAVVGYRIPGGGAINLQFLDRALYQVDVYDDDPNRARDIAEWCRTAFFEAQLFGKRFPHGSISNYSETAAPAVVRYLGQPTGETFVPATYQLYICP